MYVVRDQEILACDNHQQPTLAVLKKKGAPIVGTFHLDFDKSYDVTVYECLINKALIVEFNKNKGVKMNKVVEFLKVEGLIFIIGVVATYLLVTTNFGI